MHAPRLACRLVLLPTLAALALSTISIGFAASAQADTLAKIKSSGSVTMGVRESSGALSYTTEIGRAHV